MPSKREPTYRRAQRLKRKELAAAKAKRRIKQAETSVVYFIRIPPSDLIKIGTTNSIKKRMATFRCGSPTEPQLLAIIPGGYDLEKRLHKRFCYAKDHLEWYHPTEDLVNFIEAINAGSINTDDI